MTFSCNVNNVIVPPGSFLPKLIWTILRKKWFSFKLYMKWCAQIWKFSTRAASIYLLCLLAAVLLVAMRRRILQVCFVSQIIIAVSFTSSLLSCVYDSFIWYKSFVRQNPRNFVISGWGCVNFWPTFSSIMSSWVFEFYADMWVSVKPINVKCTCFFFFFFFFLSNF